MIDDDVVMNDEMYDDEYTFHRLLNVSYTNDVGINHVDIDRQRFDSSLKDGYFYICSEQNSAH